MISRVSVKAKGCRLISLTLPCEQSPLIFLEKLGRGRLKETLLTGCTYMYQDLDYFGYREKSNLIIVLLHIVAKKT